MKEDELIEKIYQILIRPKRWRRKFLKWLCPELVDIATAMREYYWDGGGSNRMVMVKKESITSEGYWKMF